MLRKSYFCRRLDPVPLAGVGAFLLLSALFSGYETAFFSQSRAQIDTFYEQHKRQPWAHWLRYFSECPETLLSVILIGNTLANLGITLLLFYIGRSAGTPYGEAVSAGVALALIVFVGEILPKSLAIAHPKAFLRAGTPVVQVVFWLVYPIGRLLEKLWNQVEQRWQPTSARESLSQIIDALPAQVSPPTEKRVLKNLLLLRTLPVKAFMLSRMDMQAVPINLSWSELKAALASIPYIRVPVYRESLDDIAGVLLLKDLLPHWQKEELSNWQALIRPVYFVPELKNAYELLLEFKNRRQHVAIVVDEFGSVAGIISLQRLLEVIFGYGEEEEPAAEALYSVEADGAITFQAQVPLVMVQELLGLPTDFFQEEEVRTAENLAEFLLSLAQRIPQQGEVFFYRDYAFEVVESHPHRIERIRAYRVVSEPPSETESLPSLGNAQSGAV